MRRRLPWLVALPLMAAGSFAAHALTYFLVAARAHEAGSELAERSSSGFGAHSALALGLTGALAFAAAGDRLLALLRGRPRRGASPWLFFLLPPLAFSLQELSERLLSAEAAPFQAALEPRFLVGLALQLPLGLVALLLARVLLRVAERIRRALTRPHPPSLTRRVQALSLPTECELPRLTALALGYPQRGPPPR